MFEGECDLTYEEESQIEQPANIYSIIRTLEFIEWAYNFSHIDKETYLEQTNTILEQYKVSVEAYKDKFNGIDDFCQKYGLTDCKYAINRVKQGNVIISNDFEKNKYNIIMNLTQRFNDTSSFFFINSENPIVVADLLDNLNDLNAAIYSAKNIISIEDNDIKKIINWYSVLKQRKAADILDPNEVKQIDSDVKIAYAYVNNSLKK
jgi:hypothetical protein